MARTPEQLAGAARRGRRRCGRRRPARARARDRRRRHRRAAARAAARRDGAAGDRRDPPGALALPLLHGVRRRGRATSTATRSRSELERLGDSLLVVGDATALKVHVHTDDPGAALSLGTRAARSTASRSRTCTSRREQREERLLAPCPTRRGARAGVVAVVAGDGNRRLFESLGEAAVGRRGRPDDEPVDRRPPRRGRGRSTPTRRRPAEQLQRPPRRRARRRARRARRPRSCRPTPCRPGSPRWSRSTARAPRPRTPPRCARRVDGRRDRRGHDRLARRRAQRPRDPQGRLARPRSRASRSRAASDFDEVAGAVVDAAARRAARRCSRCSPAREPPPLDGLLERLAAAYPELEVEVQRRRPAALSAAARRRIERRAGMGPPVRIVLVEDNDVFREALELLLGLRDDIEVVALGRRRRRGGRGRASEHRPDVVLMDYRPARASTASRRRRRCMRGVPGRRRRLPDRVRGRARGRGAPRGRRGRVPHEGPGARGDRRRDPRRRVGGA